MLSSWPSEAPPLSFATAGGEKRVTGLVKLVAGAALHNAAASASTQAGSAGASAPVPRAGPGVGSAVNDTGITLP